MIINLYMEMENPQGMRINYKFLNEKTNEVVATATNNFKEHTTLYYDDKKYELVNYPKKMERIILNSKYPLCSNRKWAIGFNVLSDNNNIASYYHEAVTCGKRWIFKKNMGLTVIKYNNQPYSLYRVGFAKENWHYYCLYNNSNKIVGIIKRLYGEDIRATLYIEDNSELLINLIACTIETIDVANSGDMDTMIDTSAGNYISLLEEEKAMFDKTFIERVEQL